MRDHARAQTAALDRQNAEEGAIDSDHQHSSDSLIAMRTAEEHCGDQHPHPDAAGRARELLLQIAAKDKLLADSGGNAERDPESGLGEACGSELADLFLRTLQMEEAKYDRECCQYQERENPKERGCCDIDEEFAETAAVFSQNLLK